MIVKVCDRCGATNSTHLFSSTSFYYEGEKMEQLIYADNFYETDIGLLCESCDVEYSKIKEMFKNGLI